MDPREEAARRAAIDYVLAVMAERGVDRGGLAAAATLDPGTVGDFLNGKRWPSNRTQNLIESALVVPHGSIERTRITHRSDDSRSPIGSDASPASDVPPTVRVIDNGLGLESGKNVVTIKVAALGVEMSSTFTDSEDRARVIAEMVRGLGLEGLDKQ
jgi:hypothetical protein